jgi:hypothetical protein
MKNLCFVTAFTTLCAVGGSVGCSTIGKATCGHDPRTTTDNYVRQRETKPLLAYWFDDKERTLCIGLLTDSQQNAFIYTMLSADSDEKLGGLLLPEDGPHPLTRLFGIGRQVGSRWDYRMSKGSSVLKVFKLKTTADDEEAIKDSPKLSLFCHIITLNKDGTYTDHGFDTHEVTPFKMLEPCLAEEIAKRYLED